MFTISSTAALILQDEAMVFPAIVSLMHAWQLGNMAQGVGKLRGKFKVSPPAVTGDPGFERGLRAQQNTLEFVPMFMILLWISAKFLNPVLASVTALLYISSRSAYFTGYCASADKRIGPFKRCVKVIMLMFMYSLIGLTHTILATYFKIYIPQILGLNNYIRVAN